MLQGFKNFIARGNVVDLAVGVIIGAAFGGIVDAVVKGLIDPALGATIGQPQFDWKIGVINLGLVITAIVNFLIRAAAIYFFIVLPFNRFAAKLTPPPSPTESLLGEIRDLMKKQTQQRGASA